MIRKLIGITAIYLSVSLCGLAQTERIVILHTNDTHSQMEPFAATHKKYGGLGGATRRMAIIDSIRNAEPNVLLVDAGDAIQGTPYFNLFKGDAEFEAMNAMRYDIRTIGNHEFDAGMTKLAQLIIICQLQKIISIVNPRLPGGQLHKMMLHADLVQIIARPSLIKSKASEYKRVSCCHERTVLPSRSLGKSGDLPPLSCEKDDPLVIFSHRHGREHYSLHSYQITHSLCFLTVFLFRFPSYRNQSS